MKTLLNTGTALVAATTLLLTTGTAFAGEAENIAACADAVNTYTGGKVDEFDVVYEGAFLSFSVAKWPKVECEVTLASVWSLRVNGNQYIVEGFSGLKAKNEYEKLEVKTKDAIALLNTREDILERRLLKAEEQLRSPKPNIKEIKAKIDQGIKKATGQ